MNTAIPTLPRPRSYVQSVILVAIPSMMAAAIVWTVQTGLMTDRAFFEQIFPYGLLGCFHVGLILGLVVALFIRGETTTIEYLNVEEFVIRLDAVLARLHYYPATDSEFFLTYKPSWRGGIAAGRISVRLFEDCATIVGPRYYVRKLKRRFETAEQAAPSND
jgi:hypothetical protein